jgi:flagella basal body P-ring formation protein FlgA
LIRYGAGRTHPVWARVRVRAESPRVIALRALPAGRPIEADAVEVRLIESPVFQPPAPAAVEAVAGRIPRRTIRVGEWVDGRILAAPRDVEAGEIVEVEVRSGAARVAFQGKAESGGRAGDSILIRNRQTGRRLRAVVAGKGKVSVDEGSSMADLRSGGGRLGGQEAR